MHGLVLCLVELVSQVCWYADVRYLYLQTLYSEVSDQLQLEGFEPGWGKTVGRAKDTMDLALNLLEAPDSARLAEFLSRTPNMFNVVILSPHGYFGQKDVLGKPDTGGQVCEIMCCCFVLLGFACLCSFHEAWYNVPCCLSCLQQLAEQFASCNA